MAAGNGGARRPYVHGARRPALLLIPRPPSVASQSRGRVEWRLGFCAPSMALLQLHDIRKTYTLGEVEVQALRGVSLEIDAGEYVALMGPSGSGKTTLMNTLGCLDHPTDGSYLLDGEEVTEMSGDERARLRNRKIGFVFQNFNLLSRTSAIENVELPMLYAARLRTSQRRERVRGLLGKVGLAAGWTITRHSSPAASSSGRRSPGRWPMSRRSCWPTSRRATSTRARATR